MNKYIIGIILLIIIVLIYKYYNKTTKKHKTTTRKLDKVSEQKNTDNEFDYLLSENHTFEDENNQNILDIDFIPSDKFIGEQNNYVFKTGQYGLGYYLDK